MRASSLCSWHALGADVCSPLYYWVVGLLYYRYPGCERRFGFPLLFAAKGLWYVACFAFSGRVGRGRFRIICTKAGLSIA